MARWIWKTEIIETPIEDRHEFVRRVEIAIKHILSLKKSFTIDNILRELWERNLNLGDLRVENKREKIDDIVSDIIGDREDYSPILDHRSQEYCWTYHPPIEPETPRHKPTIYFLPKKKSKSIKKLMGLKGKLK